MESLIGDNVKIEGDLTERRIAMMALFSFVIASLISYHPKTGLYEVLMPPFKSNRVINNIDEPRNQSERPNTSAIFLPRMLCR